MSRKDDVSFVKDVATVAEIEARKPFEVSQENRRRFIRIEIATPMTMQKIKESEGQFFPEVDWHMINGSILNISAGGLLVDVDQMLFSGDIVSMSFGLQGSENIDAVLGLVKRVDPDDQSFLAGIEFVSRKKLADLLSESEIEALPENLTDFNDSLRTVLNKYVYREENDADR